MPPQTPTSIRLSENPTASESRKSQRWSSEDMNDIYERRQSGENWRSIEKDYPNRTVNALRVRCAMVKAQKVQADDKSVKRQLERQSLTEKRAPTLVEPHSIPSSSALSDLDDTTTVTSYHPQSSSRSASNPARTEEWILTCPNLHGGQTAKSSSVGVQQEEPDTSLANVADGEPMTDAISDHRPFKKPRLSTELSKSPAQSFTSCSMHLPVDHNTPVIQSSKLCTDSADDGTILRLQSTLSGSLNATMNATLNDFFGATLSDTFKAKEAAAEAVLERHRAAWEGARGRANRRANEAEQKLEKERAKHSAITKSNEQRLVEHENAKVAAEQSARDAQAIIISKDERLMKLESLRSAAVDREQEVKAINEGLRKTVFEKDSELAKKEEQMELYDDLREKLCTEIGKLPEAQRQNDMVLEAIKGHQAGFGRIWKLLNIDAPASKLLGYVDELRTECEGVQPWLDGVVTRLQAATDTFATFRTRFTSSEPDGSSFDEKPRSGSIGSKVEDK